MNAGHQALSTTLVSATDWRACAHHDHLVQFYENDAFLVDSISGFIGDALDSGHGAIVIATQSHRDAVEHRLKTPERDVTNARKSGQYVALDAAQTLEKFMVDGAPDEQRFVKVVGGLIKRAPARYSKVQVFGEMVALLWAEGNFEAAIRLERLWNDLSRVHPLRYTALIRSMAFRNTSTARH